MLSLALPLLVQVSDSSLSVRFIGNEAFVITDGRGTIVTDFPYRSGAFGYIAYERPAPFPGPREVTGALSIGQRRALDSSGDMKDRASLLAAKGVTHAFVSPWLWATLVRGADRPGRWEVIIQHHTAGQRVPSCEGCWVPRQNESAVLVAPRA